VTPRHPWLHAGDGFSCRFIKRINVILSIRPNANVERYALHDRLP
jgi:hypothetical protein